MAAAVGIAISNCGQRSQLACVQQSRRNFYAQHLEPRLALSVGPVLQAKRTELLIRDFAAQQLSRPLFEHTYFALDRLGCMALFDFFVQHGWLRKTKRPTCRLASGPLKLSL